MTAARERLAELLVAARRYARETCTFGACEDCTADKGENCRAELEAGYLIDRGVTVRGVTDLTGKCGSCIYAEQTEAFGKSEIYVQCRNPELELRRRRPLSGVKARTTPACGRYVRQQTPQPRCIFQDDQMPGRRRCMATKDMEPCIGYGSCLVYKPEETK